MKNRKTVWKRAGVYPANGGGPATLLALLLVAGCLPLAATTVTGTVKLPDGTLVNGTIEFILSQQARTTAPPALYANRKTTCSITSGAIAGGCTVQGNDTLDPAGTFYSVRIIDSNNVEIMPATQYTISGASVDLGTLAISADATLQLPSGSVTGNLTITGNLTVSGSSTLSGNVGIGTASPQSSLHVLANGTAGTPAITGGIHLVVQGSVAAGSGSGIAIISGTTGAGVINFGDTDDDNFNQIIVTHSDDNMTFRTSNNPRMTIEGFGDVGIGITNPDTLLHVAGDGKFKNSADSILTVTLDSGSTATQAIDIEFNDRGTAKFTIRKPNDNSLRVMEGSTARILLAALGDSVFSTGSTTTDAVFKNSAGTIRFKVLGDLDRVTFGVDENTALEKITSGQLLVTDLFAFDEMTAPSAPATNRALLYAKDNGSGKTQLCVIFNTGAEQCFATQP